VKAMIIGSGRQVKAILKLTTNLVVLPHSACTAGLERLKELKLGNKLNETVGCDAVSPTLVDTLRFRITPLRPQLS